MNKKYMMFGLLGLFAVALVSAAVIDYYGQVEQTINIEQAVVLTCPEDLCSEDIVGFSGDTLMSNVYSLDNFADSSREVELVSTQVGIDTNEVDTTYLKMLDYEYSKTWTNNGDILVTVEDTNDGWLEWTYTTITTPTSGRLKMTVEIDNPTGFGITTFDDGSHDGWYYYDSDGTVRISDYDSTNKVSGYDWVETSFDSTSTTVRIEKSMLPNTFMWQGFANFHLIGSWIELDTNGSPWTPTANATIREDLSSQFTMDTESNFDFVIVNEIADLSNGISDGIITTEVLPVTA